MKKIEHRKPWTTEDDHFVLAHTISEAAQTLERSTNSVSLRRWRLHRQGKKNRPMIIIDGSQGEAAGRFCAPLLLFLFGLSSRSTLNIFGPNGPNQDYSDSISPLFKQRWRSAMDKRKAPSLGHEHSPSLRVPFKAVTTVLLSAQQEAVRWCCRRSSCRCYTQIEQAQ